MKTPSQNALSNTGVDNSDVPQKEGKTYELEIEDVPVEALDRVRRNAAQSGMTFDNYIIALLATSEPVEPMNAIDR